MLATLGEIDWAGFGECLAALNVKYESVVLCELDADDVLPGAEIPVCPYGLGPCVAGDLRCPAVVGVELERAREVALAAL